MSNGKPCPSSNNQKHVLIEQIGKNKRRNTCKYCGQVIKTKR